MTLKLAPVPDNIQKAEALAAQISDAAQALGFCSVGFADPTSLPRDRQALQEWLAAGRHGDMHYMAEHGTRDIPAKVFSQASTLVVVALPYGRGDAQPSASADASYGVVARYARGADYHTVLRDKLHALAEACACIVGRPVAHRPCVDTAPLLERGYAARAGIAFAAKNTMSIVPGVGSYVLLGELLLDVYVTPSAPAVSKCGACTRCITACPTQAFVSPHVLDARRCISYLTIELRGPIPRHLRPLMGNLVFGCDICQEVCPFNAGRGAAQQSSAFHEAHVAAALPLLDLLTLTSAGYRRLVRGTALRRASRAMLARNAAVALGNSGDRRAVTALANALHQHRYTLVRGHAAWALGRLGGTEAQTALQGAHGQALEADVWLAEEVALARVYCAKLASTGA